MKHDKPNEIIFRTHGENHGFRVFMAIVLIGHLIAVAAAIIYYI